MRAPTRPDDVGAPLDLLIDALERVCGGDLGAMVLSPTLPRSETPVMLEGLLAVRAAHQHAADRGQDAPADGGQARTRWRSGLDRGAGAFSPRAAGAGERRRRAGTRARGGSGHARSDLRNGPAP